MSTIVLADDKLPDEMYMANDTNGIITLTITECKLPEAIKQGYEYRAYATDGDKDVTHEGCWVSPSTKDAPRASNIRIIPLVNTWWEDGGRYTYEQQQFKPKGDFEPEFPDFDTFVPKNAI